MTLKDQIKSPKWQKRRLEILSRDKFTCQSCGATDETLHVHHIKYIRTNKYWEYPDNLLITLCEECHAAEHLSKDEWIGDVIKDINSLGIMYTEINGALRYIFAEILGDEKTPPKSLEEIFVDKDLSSFVMHDVNRISKWRKSTNK